MKQLALPIIVVLCLLSAHAPHSRAQEDKLVGRVWEITYKHPSGKDILQSYRATPEGKVYAAKNPRELGTWTGAADKATLKIVGFKGDIAWKNGTYNLVLVKKKPLEWQGQYKGENGKTLPITVTLIED